jgi:hypothetical protein
MFKFLEYLPERDRARVLAVILKIPGMVALALILDALVQMVDAASVRVDGVTVTLLLVMAVCVACIVFSIMGLFWLYGGG